MFYTEHTCMTVSIRIIPILPILRACRFAQIVNSIILCVSIDVIQPLKRPLAVMDKPYQAMRVIIMATDIYSDVWLFFRGFSSGGGPFPCVRPSRRFPN